MFKSLLMASALTMAFSSAAMAGDGSSTSGAAGCSSCGLTAPIAMAQRGPVNTVSGTTIPKNFEAIAADREGLNICCPPLDTKPLGQFDRLPTPSGNGAAPYGIKFTRDPGLDGAMIGFAPFLSQFIPAGYEPNSVHLNAELRRLDQTLFPRTSLPTSAAFTTGTPTSVKQHSLRSWWLPVAGTLAPTGVWSGPLWPNPNASNPAYDWSRIFEDGYPSGSITPAHMQPNQWYMVKLKFQVAMKRVGDPNSWIVKDLNCTNMKPKFFRIKFDYDPVAKTTGGKQFTVDEIN